MHTLSKMQSFLSSHLPSPPLSLPKSPSPHKAHLFPLPTILERRPFPKNPIFLLPKTPLPASRRYASRRTDRGHLHPVEDRKKFPPFGEVHVFVGPMFAGKTTALLRKVQLEGSNGRKYAIIKSNKDNRYGLDSVVTHDGFRMPCWALSKLSAFRATIGDKAYEELDVIGIDEAQFFEDLYDFCQHAADHDGKAVFVAGLDGDYLRRRFGSVTDIIPLADSVTKLTAQCEVCGNQAFFTLRKTIDTETEVIGGADVYMPVCRRHYVDGQVAVETGRLLIESQKAQQLKEASLPS